MIGHQNSWTRSSPWADSQMAQSRHYAVTRCPFAFATFTAASHARTFGL